MPHLFLNVGQTIHCTARVIHAEDREVTFQISARDERELIARGLHKRAVIRVDHFAAGCWKSPLRTRTACPRLMEPLGRVLFISWLGRLNRHKKC